MKRTPFRRYWKSLLLLDFQPLGLTKEVIVVERRLNRRFVRHRPCFGRCAGVQTPTPAGRGAACASVSRSGGGSIVSFFPGDREYKAEDLYLLVQSVVQSGFRAVLGTRAIKTRDLSASSRAFTRTNAACTWSASYGGIVLSIATLLLYNRYINGCADQPQDIRRAPAPEPAPEV